jgi:hypothetical protein
MNGAAISVWWGRGDEVEALVKLSPRNWGRIQAGKPLRIRGKGYWYEGKWFQGWWKFNGVDELVVGYGNDAAVGFIGVLRQAWIIEVNGN